MVWGITYCTIKTEKLLDNKLHFTPFPQIILISSYTETHFNKEKITDNNIKVEK